MKKGFFLILGMLLGGTLMFSSCTTYNHSMKSQDAIVELKASDFELSEQVSAEATVEKIFFIDWTRLFGKTETGTIGKVEVLGNIGSDPSKGYALYKLMQENPGYDIVVYPQYEIHKVAPILGTNLVSHTKVKVTARLGKLKK